MAITTVAKTAPCQTTTTGAAFVPKIEETHPGDEEDSEPTALLGPDVLFRDSFEFRD